MLAEGILESNNVEGLRASIQQFSMVTGGSTDVEMLELLLGLHWV